MANHIMRRCPRALFLSACLLLVPALIGCARVSTSAGKIPATRAGFSGSWKILWESDADLRRDFDNMAATGAKWIRIDFDWKSIQSTGPSSWKWQYQDRVVNMARAHGMNILAVPTYSPSWAQSSACRGTIYCPPGNPNDYANFVRAAAQRYAPLGIHSWEIWNEPNWYLYWAGAPNAHAYVALLRAAYGAIHGVDRYATVVTGGLAPHGDLNQTPNDPISPVNFLQAIYAAGGKGYFDAFGIHPYPPMPHDPLSGKIGWNAIMQTSWEHAIMASHGDGGKKIWGTETGIPTGSTSVKAVSQSTQALYLSETFRYWAAQSFTGPLFVHTVRDDVPASASDYSAYEGVFNRNFMPKPAALTLRGLLG